MCQTVIVLYCDVLPVNSSNNLWILDFMLDLLDTHQAEFTITYNLSNYIT
jgi:hypothetical protein